MRGWTRGFATTDGAVRQRSGGSVRPDNGADRNGPAKARPGGPADRAFNRGEQMSAQAPQIELTGEGQDNPVGGWRETVRKLMRARLPVVGLALLVIFVLLAAFAPYITSYDPHQVMAGPRHSPPSWKHLFGTDVFGRDILTRVLYGARISLLIAFTTIVVRAAIGIPLGLVSGYYRGKLDAVIMRVADVFLAIPEIMFALVIVAVRGPSFWNIVLALSVRGWTGFARLTRGETLRLRDQAFVESAHSCGATDWRVIVIHILPQIASTLVVYTTLNLAWPILMEATLGFLGLGVPPPTPTLGGMLSDERAYLLRAWWSSLLPGLSIMLAIFSFNLFGDGLRDALDPELKD